jgi:phage-related minor tail protein
VRTIANNIKGITVEIGGETGPLEKALKGVNKTTRELQGELKAVEKALKLDPKNTVLLAQKQELLAQSINNTKEKLETLKKAEEQAQAKFAQGEISEQQYRALQREIINTSSELINLETRAEESNEAIDKVSDATEKIGAAGDKMKNVGKSMSVGVTAPILAFGAAGVAAFNSVDEALDTIITKTGATGASAKAMADSFETVAGRVPDDLTSVGEAIGEVNTQFGFMGKELEDASQLMLEFASINGTDVTSSAIASKQAIEAYKLENKDLGSVLDAVTKTAQDTGQAVDFLFDKATAGAPQIKALGLSFAEGTALIGGFEKAGVDSGAALSGLAKAQVLFAKDGKTLEQGLNDTIKSITGAKSETEALTEAAKVFGTKGASRMVDAIKRGTFNLGDFANAGKDAAGAVKDTFNETVDPIDQAAIAMNNAKLAMAKVGDAIQIALLPLMEKATKLLGRLSSWFKSLSPEMMNTILAVAGIAAAIGPLLVIGGTLVSSVGSIITAFGAATTAIAGTGGLVAGFGLLTGPIGLTLAAVGLVTAAIVGFSKSSKENNTVSFESLQVRQKEIDKTDDLIKNFDALNIKNQLSNSEMGRFLDINSDLASTTSPERITALKDEQAKLLEKSGLTNKEMDNFLAANDKIIEKAPNTETAISAQGKAFATNTFELQKVNAEKLHGLKIDAEMAINNNIGKENELLKEQKKLRDEIVAKEQLHKETYANINTLNTDIVAKEKEINGLKGDRSLHGQELLAQAELEYQTLEKQKSTEETKLGLTLGEVNARQTSLGIIDADLKKLDEQKFKYESIILATVGLTAERGKGLATIQTEIAKLEQEKIQLREMHSSGQLNTAEYNEQVGAIDAQIGKLQGANTELKNVNETAGKTIYKGIVIDGSSKEYAEELNRLLQKPISKTVSVTYPKGYGRNVPMNAKGNRNFTGGLSTLAELGRELLHIPGMPGLALANQPGLFNLPRGTKIIPNVDTEKILKNWNIPMLANGGEALSSGMAIVAESGRELMDMRGATTRPLSEVSGNSRTNNVEYISKQPIIIQPTLNGQVIAEATFDMNQLLFGSASKNNAFMNGVR